MNCTCFSEIGAHETSYVHNLRLNTLMARHCQTHFNFLSRLGFQNIFLYGGALRDTIMEHKLPISDSTDAPLHPKDYDYIVHWPWDKTPRNGEPLKFGSPQIMDIYEKILAESDMVETCQHKRANEVRFKFHLRGDTIDLGIPLDNTRRSFNQMANYGSIGLSAIAMDETGETRASIRFKNDYERGTLSVSPDLKYHETVRAEEKARILHDRYNNVGIPLTLIIPVKEWDESEIETARSVSTIGYSFP